MARMSVVLCTFPLLALCCIPTKTPEPGIPAVTPTPSNCPPITPFDATLCTGAFGQNAVCTPAIISTTTVSCGNAAATLAGATPDFQINLGPGMNAIKCVGTDWYITATNEKLFSTTAELICYTETAG